MAAIASAMDATPLVLGQDGRVGFMGAIAPAVDAAPLVLNRT